MKTKHKVNIIIAIIGIIGTISASIISVKWAENNVTIIVQLDGHNVVLDNDGIQEMASENENLRIKISDYEAQIETLENNGESLSEELSNANGTLQQLPVIEYHNYGFYIDGDEKAINKNNSYLILDGNEYFSRGFIEALLPENANLTIKDEAVFIGKIIADKANLFNQTVMEKQYCSIQNTATDSYGNTYSNLLFMSTEYYTNSDYIIYVLDGKYSLLRFSAAIRDTAVLGGKGILTIKADDKVVYTSGELDKQTKLFTESDIPIDNCDLLTIEYNSDGRNGCMITEAAIYN